MRNRNVVVAGLIAGMVAACADAVSDGAGHAMRDAGEMLRDAGRSLGDGGSGALAGAGGALGDAGQALADAGEALIDASLDSGTASAAEPTIFEAGCDIELTRRLVLPDASWTERTAYFAEVDAPDAYPENMAGVVALLCQWDTASPPNDPECEGDAECVDSGDGDFRRPAADCKQTSDVEFTANNKLAVQCGATGDSSTGLPYGGHWNFVRFIVPSRP